MLITVALLVSLMPSLSLAGLVTVTLTDGATEVRFQVDRSPTPMSSNAGGFTLGGVLVTVSGQVGASRDITFWDLALAGGGLTISGLLSQMGPQLYTGEPSQPTLLDGVFSLTHYDDPTFDESITSDLRATVPAPGALGLLGAGLIALGFSRRRNSRLSL